MMRVWSLRVVGSVLGIVWLVLLALITIHHNYTSSLGGSHWMGFTDREARLAERIRETEILNQWLKLQLAQVTRRKVSDQETKVPCDNHEAAPCQMIDVAVVCAGVDASRTVVTLIKSVLFYRRNPITFHFISDKEARRILSYLTSSWRLPHVTWRFYPAEEVINDVAWIPNKHYSGVYGLLKLTLTNILPLSLHKVIVLDTDVTFATDIGQLWAVFSQFTTGQALGLVENQSDWYIPGKLWKNHRPWPARGRGLNTGVILMDLSKLRKLGWSQLWRTVAESGLVTLLSTSLADQDVFNAVIRRQSDLLHTLSCRWNVQLSDNSLSDSLCYDKQGLKVGAVHFNSPKKLSSDNKHVNLFRNLHISFIQYDGNLLRRELYNCPSNETDITKDNEDETADECKTFRDAGDKSYRTHIFFVPHCQSNKTVTLVAQLSVDRLHMIDLILGHWEGPVSLALYLSDPETQTFLLMYENSPLIQSRCDVSYHVVYKEGELYPVNFLRNLALDQVYTEFVFLADIDFLPSMGAAHSLQASVQHLLTSTVSKRVLIVPAFESHSYKTTGEARFPATKAELIKRLDLGQMFTFRQHDWPAGHQATNFVKWRSATTPYVVEWKQNFEPYLVARTKQIPRYDTRFVGFGWNKVSHVIAMHAEGVEMVVLPDVFIIHQPHAPSMEIFRYRTQVQYRTCLDRLKAEFLAEIENKMGIKLSIGD